MVLWALNNQQFSERLASVFSDPQSDTPTSLHEQQVHAGSDQRLNAKMPFADPPGVTSGFNIYLQ